MWLAALLVVAGVSASAVVGRRRGGRAAGLGFIPVLGVVALYRWYVLPVYLLAVGLAYLLLPTVERRTLVSGGRAALAAVGIGAVASLVLLAPLWVRGAPIEPIALAGSLLPGAAAHRLRRLSPGDRRRTAVLGTGSLLVVVLVGGVAAVLFVTPPCLTCGLVPWGRLPSAGWFLLRPSSDLGAAVLSDQPDVVGDATPALATLAVVALAAALATGVQTRWGLGLVGPVALPLLATSALQSRWAVPAYLVAVIASFAVLVALGRRGVGEDGPVGIGYVVGLLAVLGVSLVTSLPGLPAFIVGVLGGVGGHRLRRLPPPDRPWAAAVASGLFTAVFAAAVVGIGVSPAGLAATATFWHHAVGVVACVGAVAALVRYEWRLPSRHEIAEASIIRREAS